MQPCWQRQLSLFGDKSYVPVPAEVQLERQLQAVELLARIAHIYRNAQLELD
eukprot:COSAG06_NODE_27547_length_591_cov_0.867886_2_plen_51_part_01